MTEAPATSLIKSGSNRMDEGASILVIGDVHLGTACSGVPDEIFILGP